MSDMLRSVAMGSDGLVPPSVHVTERPDGVLVCASTMTLESGASTMVDFLVQWSRERPGQTFMAERAGDRWRDWSYREADEETSALALSWRSRGLAPGRSLLVLASNSIDHARLMLAGQRAGVPVASVNPRYAESAAGLARLASIVDVLQPQAVAMDDAAASCKACVALLERTGATRMGLDGSIDDGPATGTTGFTPGAVGPGTVARIFFTSGSTGTPKAVPYTQRMMTSNVEMLLQVWPFMRQGPLVMLDWLPWSHVFGGNNNINIVLATGGTLHIDAGMPTPTGMPVTLDNLAQVSPTFYCNVPAGYAALVDALEASASLRDRFFARLKAVFFAAAAMPEPLWQRLQALAEVETGRRIPVLSGWGATESGPSATLVQRADAAPGNVGTPIPGVSLKLKPVGHKLEAWIRSPSVTAGYLGHAQATATAFDDEGYFRSGDALRFADPHDPGQGFIYDGRIAEDFKLQSGTWVNAIAVRTALLKAGRGAIKDVVLLGPNRPCLCALVWMTGVVDPDDAEARLDEIVQRYNEGAEGRSQRIAAAGLLMTPPDAEAGEINEKGHVNQARARDLRVADADRLYERLALGERQRQRPSRTTIHG